MKTLKYFSLVFLMLFSVRVMAQNEIKMHTGTVNIGEGKTYYFFDSGGEEEFTIEEDPGNDYRWKTWYNHNESYTLTFKVPEGSTKGILVTFRSLLINNDHLKIYEGDVVNEDSLIADLTCTDYSTEYGTFSVMSHKNMTIQFKSDKQYRDAGWIAEVKLESFAPQAPIIMREACDNEFVVLSTCKGKNSTSYKYNINENSYTAADPANGTNYTLGTSISLVNKTYPITVSAIAYVDNVSVQAEAKTFTSDIAAPPFTTSNYTYTDNEKKKNIIEVKTLRDPNINDTWYVRYIMNNTATQTATDAAAWPEYTEKPDPNNPDNIIITNPDGYKEIVNPGGIIDYTNTTLTPDFYVHMLIRGTTCPDKFSAIQTVKVTDIYAPKPEITFDNGKAIIKTSLAGAVIRYTTNGNDPDGNSSTATLQTKMAEDGETVEYYYIEVPGLTLGQTVKAMTTKTDFTNSDVATEIYAGSGSGVSGSIVLIDDREDHNMSYYQKAADLPAGYPTEYLSSPDPRNVKITYKGGSVANASAVAISALSGEGQNEMIYLKTMEKTVIGMTGDYPYTVISNPFSKRPAETSGNSKTYYGFAGWKVISGDEYISEYSNGQTLPLDATIHFVNLDNNYTPNCLSAEIVFEATWTTATVKTGSSAQTFTGGTYETNFWVLTGNPSNGVTVPGNSTMTARYPDGEVRWSGNFTRAITAGGDNAKVEFVNMNSTGDVNAAGYTFTMGRGIVNSGNGGQLQGCTSNKACEHTVKIESGKYASLRHFTNNISSGNTINQQMILGCDYDRAKGDNDKLEITGTMYVASSINLYRTSSTTPYVRCYIKSGNFNSNSPVNSSYLGLGNESYYFSINGTHNAGRRYLEVEGGHLRSIAGGMDDNDDQSTTGRSLDIRVRGTAQIDGAVYGAAEFVGAKGTRTMVFTGGKIEGWIAGGCNGTATTGGKLDGNTYIYVGGTAEVGNKNGGNHVGGNYHNTNQSTYGKNGADGGSVFGAGCGILTTSSNYTPNTNYQGDNYTVGKVNNSNVIVADNAIIWRDVYGGGNYGQVETDGTSNIYIIKGTIKGNVYGGANNQKGQEVKITMTNGEVDGSIYGGSNTWGTINDNVTMNITGGHVKGDVFGGGYGEATKVAGNVNVTIGGTNPQDTPTIAGDVYGGGALGEVNTTNGSAVASKTTHVTVNSGTMNNVYGGGLGKRGNGPTTRLVNFSWTVDGRQNTNVTFEYIDKDGNKQTETKTSDGNKNYEVKVNTDITLTATGYYSNGFIGLGSTRYTSTITARYSDNNVQIAQASSRDNTIATGDGKVIASNPDETPIAANVGTVTVDIKGGNMINVFGCNNLNGAPQGSVTVNFDGGEAVDVYGGGNWADYLPDNTLFPIVNITKGKITNAVYGGGAMARVNKTQINMTGGEANNVFAGAQGNNKNETLVLGNKTVNMYGKGTAIAVYGGSYTCKDVANSFVYISGGRVKTHVFGSGYFGDMVKENGNGGNCYVYIGKNAVEYAPHADESDERKVAEDISKLNIWIEGNVYAGANWGTYDPKKGFGASTIEGISNIYIDGEGYNMKHGKKDNYMILGGSVYGCGTSCDGGNDDHSVIIRKYGEMTYPSMTRSLKSIQKVKELVLYESNIDFTGQGNITSMDPTIEYGICNIEDIIRVTSGIGENDKGTNIALSKPMDFVKKLGSYTCTKSVYEAAASDYTPTTSYEENGTTTTFKYENVRNGVVINSGGYLKVYYEYKEGEGDNQQLIQKYGELEGYFYMREPGDDAGINNEGYIFARPKYIKNEGKYNWPNTDPNSPSPASVNAQDGGFVDYNETSTKNIFDKYGNEAPQSQTYMRKAYAAPSVQMPYTNKTNMPNGEENADNSSLDKNYRYWRYDPDADYPISTREIVFVVKADDDAETGSTKFLTTSDGIVLPPSLNNESSPVHHYYITDLVWGADGKDCNPAPYTATSAKSETDPEAGSTWMCYNTQKIPTPDFDTKTISSITTETEELKDYFADPNSTFGFLMQFHGNFATQTDKILDDESYASYYKNYQNPLAAINTNNTTDLPQLDFLVTYNDGLSQNELWSEAKMTIDEIETTIDETTGKIVPVYVNGKLQIKQRIYVNISVTTQTKFGGDVETSVYASTDVNKADKTTGLATYRASVTLPIFSIVNPPAATFKVAGKSESTDPAFGKIEDATIVTIGEWDKITVNNTAANPQPAKLALRFSADKNGDNTDGWYHKGDAENPSQANPLDYYKEQNYTVVGQTLGAADGRKYTTINFDLQYNPQDLGYLPEVKLGQHYLGDIEITMNLDNFNNGDDEPGNKQFKIIVHVYVTGSSRFYYLDGVAGRDGNSGMFPDQAKKTFNGVLNADGYTFRDPIFVVDKVSAKSNGSLTWDADKFLNAELTDAEKELKPEQQRVLRQVKVYRYPGGHYLSNGKTTLAGFDNVMFTGKMVDIPENATFNMHNVRLSGGSDLDEHNEYNPNRLDAQGIVVGNPITATEALITIGEDATVTINNSALLWNKNASTTNKAGAIYNQGILNLDGVRIDSNISTADNGIGAGVYVVKNENGRSKMLLHKSIDIEAPIVIADQVFLEDQCYMEAPNGLLQENSSLGDVMVYLNPEITDLTHYSGRVIVRYTGAEPSAPDAPFWKTLSDSDLPQKQTSMLKSRKANSYESDKYILDNELTKAGVEFRLANGGSELVLPYIVDAMKEEYAPTANDIIMYRTDANLPVELLYFHATCMGDAVQFEWATASETNNEYFTIERSTDAVNYEEVARIQGAGTTSQRSDYSFMADNNSSSMTYYRLRQTDIDGKYEIFAPVALQCKGDKVATDISIYPVPARDQVNIFSSNSPMTRIEIYSIMGAKVAEESAESNQAVLNISNLATGVYAVKVFTEDGQVSNVRLIKK